MKSDSPIPAPAPRHLKGSIASTLFTMFCLGAILTMLSQSTLFDGREAGGGPQGSTGRATSSDPGTGRESPRWAEILPSSATRGVELAPSPSKDQSPATRLRLR